MDLAQKDKKVSVCMATYNGERFVTEQICSILSQLGDEDELIVSDDSSTDRTLELINDLNDSRIRIFPHQRFRSPGRNFENALKKATGDVIFLADQDDVWVDGKVSAMLKILDSADLVVSDAKIIDERGSVLANSYFERRNSGPGILKNVFRNSYLGCCMAFNRKVLEKALPFPKDIEFHDYWLGVVGGIFFKVVFLKEPYTLYRKHDGNASYGADTKSAHCFLRKVMFRINLLKHLPELFFRGKHLN